MGNKHHFNLRPAGVTLRLPCNYAEQGDNKATYYVAIRNNTICTVIAEKGTVIRKKKIVLITQYI